MSSGFSVRPLSTHEEPDYSAINDEITALSVPVAKAMKSAGFTDSRIDEEIPAWRNVCTSLINYRQSSTRHSIDKLEELRHAMADLATVRQFFAKHEEVLTALDRLEAEIESTLAK
jgi:hypothetical protein